MTARQCITVTRSAAAAVAALGILAAASPADALNDSRQVLTGGGTFAGTVSPVYTSPGHGNVLGPDFPSAGNGENAAQLRMPGGVLKLLKVRVHTQNVPSDGTLTVMVRINNGDTVLTCSVSGDGNCGTGGKKSVTINNGDLLAIQVASTLEDEGNVAFSYTLIFD